MEPGNRLVVRSVPARLPHAGTCSAAFANASGTLRFRHSANSRSSAVQTVGSLAGPSHSGKTQVTPQYFGLGTQMEGGVAFLVNSQFPSDPRPTPKCLGVGNWPA